MIITTRSHREREREGGVREAGRERGREGGREREGEGGGAREGKPRDKSTLDALITRNRRLDLLYSAFNSLTFPHVLSVRVH